MPYIYKITNTINGKMYIGQTSHFSIEERFQEHIRDSQKIRYEKRPLYDAMNKYGLKNFIIEKLENVETIDQANEKEIYWIKKLRTYVGFDDCNGYNATLGGDSKRLYNYEELSNAYVELGTVKDVCKVYQCDERTVRQACREKGVEIKIAPNQKRIKRIDENGDYKIYNSITEAAKDFPNKAIETARKNISRGINAHKKAYGYNWEIEEEEK